MTTSSDTHLARTFEDDRYDWTRNRRVRHRLVLAEAALVGFLVVASLATGFADDGWNTYYVVGLAVGLFGFVPLHSLLNLSIRGLYDRREQSLDEHQRSLRERSYKATSWWNAALTLAAWAGAVAMLAATGRTDVAIYLGFLFWFASSLVAYWHLAWTLPDEDADPAQP